MRRQWAESQGKEEAAQAATQARIALLERELAALKCKETREWLAAEEACANWQTPPAECKVISLVGASPAQMRSLAAEQGVAEVDRSRILVSRLGAPDVLAPPGSPPPSAPPSPPGSDGYASTQASGDSDTEGEGESPPPPPVAATPHGAVGPACLMPDTFNHVLGCECPVCCGPAPNDPNCALTQGVVGVWRAQGWYVGPGWVNQSQQVCQQVVRQLFP